MAIINSNYKTLNAEDVNTFYKTFNDIIDASGITPDTNVSDGENLWKAFKALNSVEEIKQPSTSVPREQIDIVLNGKVGGLSIGDVFTVFIMNTPQVNSVNYSTAKVIIDGNGYNVITGEYEDIFYLEKPSKVTFKKSGENTLKVLTRTFSSIEIKEYSLSDFPDKKLILGKDNNWVKYIEMNLMKKLELQPLPSPDPDTYSDSDILPHYGVTVDIELPDISLSHPTTNLKLGMDLNIAFRTKVINNLSREVIKIGNTNYTYGTSPYNREYILASFSFVVDYTDFYNNNNSNMLIKVIGRNSSSLIGFDTKATFNIVDNKTILKLHILPTSGFVGDETKLHTEPHFISLTNIGSTVDIFKPEYFNFHKINPTTFNGLISKANVTSSFDIYNAVRVPGSGIEDLSKVDDISVDSSAINGLTQNINGDDHMQFKGASKTLFLKSYKDGNLGVREETTNNSFKNMNNVTNHTILKDVEAYIYASLIKISTGLTTVVYETFGDIKDKIVSLNNSFNSLTILENYDTVFYKYKNVENDIIIDPNTTIKTKEQTSDVLTSTNGMKGSIRRGDVSKIFAIGDEGLTEEYKNATTTGENLAKVGSVDLSKVLCNYLDKLKPSKSSERMKYVDGDVQYCYPKNKSNSPTTLNTYIDSNTFGFGGGFKQLDFSFNNKHIAQEMERVDQTNFRKVFYDGLENRTPKPNNAPTNTPYACTEYFNVAKFKDGNPGNALQRNCAISFQPKHNIMLDISPVIPTGGTNNPRGVILRREVCVVNGEGKCGTILSGTATKSKTPSFQLNWNNNMSIHAIDSYDPSNSGFDNKEYGLLVITDYRAYIAKKSPTDALYDGSKNDNCVLHSDNLYTKYYELPDYSYTGTKPNERIVAFTQVPNTKALLILKSSDNNELYMVTYGNDHTMDTLNGYEGSFPYVFAWGETSSSKTSHKIYDNIVPKVETPDYVINVRPSYGKVDGETKGVVYITYIYASGVGVFAFGARASYTTSVDLNIISDGNVDDGYGQYNGFVKLDTPTNWTFNKDKIIYEYGLRPALYIDEGVVYYKVDYTYYKIRGLPPIKKFIKTTGSTSMMEIIDGMIVEDYNSKFYLLDPYMIGQKGDCISVITAREIKVPSGEEIVNCKGIVISKNRSIMITVSTSKGNLWIGEIPLSNLDLMYFKPSRTI